MKIPKNEWTTCLTVDDLNRVTINIERVPYMGNPRDLLGRDQGFKYIFSVDYDDLTYSEECVSTVVINPVTGETECKDQNILLNNKIKSIIKTGYFLLENWNKKEYIPLCRIKTFSVDRVKT